MESSTNHSRPASNQGSRRGPPAHPDTQPLLPLARASRRGSPHNPPENPGGRPTSPRIPQPSTSYYSHHCQAEVQIPLLSEEIEAYKKFDHKFNTWRNTENFYPDPLFLLENAPEIRQWNFRLLVERALTRWREHNSPMPKLYLSQKEWDSFPGLQQAIKDALTLYEVKGLENDRETTRYFINEQAAGDTLEVIKKVAEHIHLASRPPMWGIPSNMLLNRMNLIDAQAASALYRAKLEMNLFEISLYRDPT